MSIVAMTYEAGSQGKEIGRQVAQRLGLEPVCHKMFERHVADKLQADGALVSHYLRGGAGCSSAGRPTRKLSPPSPPSRSMSSPPAAT